MKRRRGDVASLPFVFALRSSAMAPIYLDHAATTTVLPEVWEAMRPFCLGPPGNAASSHAFGRASRRALENARESIASLLDAHPEEVIFTSGATEANNLALFGLCGAAPGVLVSSAIEHPCVIEPIQQLTRQGFTFTSLPVAPSGTVQPLVAGWPADTRLVSVMYANHETGAVQPIRELAMSRPSTAAFHCDAAAAAGKLPISFRQLGVTSLTISGHKFHCPPGIGALLVHKGAKLRPQLFGGHQQQGRRPGTELVALAVGMATALEWCVRKMDANLDRVRKSRQRFIERLRADASPIIVNGSENDGLPHILNVSFPGCRADTLLMNLDLAGVACSTGSACSSGSLLPSPVLKAMGVGGDGLRSAMRFSFSAMTSLTEVDEAAKQVCSAVGKLRRAEGAVS